MKQWIIILSLLMWLPACKQKETAADAAGQDFYYTCSMDPQVIAYKPGKCPICHMELTKVSKAKKEMPDVLELSDQQIRLGNINTDTIRNGSIDSKLVLTATLNFDQHALESVSAQVQGRIDRLYVKKEGDYVQRGAPLFRLYSEALNSAKQEYLAALEQQRTMDSTIIDFKQLVQAAKNKLLLWGLSEQQIRELARAGKADVLTTYYSPVAGYVTELPVQEGAYVMEGSPVITLANLSQVWVEAQVYASRLSGISAGSKAWVQLPDRPGERIAGTVTFANPEISAGTRINLVRVAIPNTDGALKPGMPAYVFLEKAADKGQLTLPTDAVLRDGNQSIVWVQTAKHRFIARRVQTGLESGFQVEITKGLQDGDVIVTSGAYLLNSEYIFKNGSGPLQEQPVL